MARALVPKIALRRQRHVIRVVATVTLIGLAVWSLLTAHAVIRTGKQIQTTATRIAELAPWSASGVWLAEATKVWEPELEATYDRLFPRQINREGLYHELASLADDCGVRGLTLARTDSRDPLERSGDSEESDFGDPLMAEFAPLSTDLPNTRLAEHRLELNFESDFATMTRFMNSLPLVSRAITVEKMHTGSISDGLSVEMELIFYVQDAD